MIDASIAMAWADGGVTEEEMVYFNSVIDACRLPEDRTSMLFEHVRRGSAVSTFSAERMHPDDAERVLQAAASTIVSDGNVLEPEREQYQLLAERLGIEKREAMSILRHFQQMAWMQ